MNKNPGKLLIDKLRGMFEALPVWVRASISVIRKHQTGFEPTIEPPPLGGGIVETSAVQQVTDERTHVTLELDPADLPKTREGQIVLPNGQVADVTETVDDSPLPPLVAGPPLVDGETETIGGAYIQRKVEAPVFPNEQFTAEIPDIIPERFKAVLPRTTTRLSEAGNAVPPTLTGTEILEVQEQIKEGVKQTTISNRDDTLLPKTLIGKTVLQNQLVATVSETLAHGTQTIVATATTEDGSVEVVGADITLKRQVESPKVFEAEVFAKERPEVIPPKFRAAVPLTTTRIDSAGNAAAPTLAVGDVSKTSEQVREFVKRDTTQTRDLTVTPVTLTGQVLTPEQQLGTVTETLTSGTQNIVPSATVLEDRVEAIGDGSTVRTRITVPNVFPNNLFSRERPEVIPAAFRAAIPLETTRADSAGTASLPTLGPNDIERISEQIKEFVVRNTTRTRTLGTFPTITLRSFDNDLQVEVLSELSIVPMGSTFTPTNGVIDYDERELSDAYSLRTVYRLVANALPPSYDTREPGTFYFPGTVTNIVVAIVALADTADGESRGEVNWQPVWRPGFTMDVNFIVTTSFHFTPPAPDTQYVIRTNDIVFKGVSFQVSLPRVLNNALTDIGVAFTDDALYNNLAENFDVPASVPSASDYNAAIGSAQIISSKVSPWRRLWVKKTTKVVLL